MIRSESPETRLPPEPVATIRRDAGRTAVFLHGEHDIATSSWLSTVMARAIGDDDVDVVIDLADVVFMDASTVGVIVRAEELMRFESRTLTVRSPSPAAARLLHLCDLANLVDTTTASELLLDGSLASWVEVPFAEAPRPDALTRRTLTCGG